MSDWSLPQLLATLHEDIHRRLEAARRTFAHTTTKGDASEQVWLQLFQQYLPQRYAADTAHVVDSNGKFSQQIDIVIFDRQYSPFILKYEGQTIIPAESVYAVFETKQAISTENVKYAQAKIRTVRKLHRTSLPIPYAGGVYPAKAPINILGGLLTFESTWPTCFGQSLREALQHDKELGRINLGCVAAHGHFVFEQPRAKVQPRGSDQPSDEERSGGENQPTGEYRFYEGDKPATDFLFRLISELQFSGTVPMIDVMAYAKSLSA